MTKRSTIEKRTRTRRRNAAKRRAMREAKAATDPKWRLINAGAGSDESIRRRMLWFASQRGIPIDKVPSGRNITQQIVKFADTYKVSIDWLFSGELRHLREIVRGPDPDKEALAELLATFAKLSPRARDKVRALLAAV